MSFSAEKVAVLGSGSWGTALAAHLCRLGHEVVLWGRDAALLTAIEGGSNPNYFPNDSLPNNLSTKTSLEVALREAAVVVIAVPASAVRKLAEQAKPFIQAKAIVVSTAKGVESESAKRMSEVLTEELGASTNVAVLSGPSFALEVLRAQHTAVTIAAGNAELADKCRGVFHSQTFRVYSSTDVVGVELGGVFKNIISLACGVVDGMELGDNARAALITRGLAEMQRFVTSMGGEKLTVVGLSGLGDLVLTATGKLSRNRQVGVRLGKGESLKDIISNMNQIAEAVYSTETVLSLSAKNQLELPIASAVGEILAGNISCKEAVQKLFARPAKSEV